VIGWLTFGRSPASGPEGRPSTVDRMAAPPPISPVPTATFATPAASFAVSRAPSHAAGSSARSVPPPRRTEPPDQLAPAPAPAVTGLEVLPEPSTVIATSSTAPEVLPPSPTPQTTIAAVQGPVTIGERCAPYGAYGRTRAGTKVRCQAFGPRRAHWKIASAS
jgi:hypothetical protein